MNGWADRGWRVRSGDGRQDRRERRRNGAWCDWIWDGCSDMDEHSDASGGVFGRAISNVSSVTIVAGLWPRIVPRGTILSPCHYPV